MSELSEVLERELELRPPVPLGVVLAGDLLVRERRLLTRALRAGGVRALEARSGPEALRALAGTSRSRLLLLSRGVEGPWWRLCREARARAGRGELYILVLGDLRAPIPGPGAGRARRSWFRALEAGADACLPRPVRARELRAQLQCALRILSTGALLRAGQGEARAACRRAEEALEAAAQVQRALLPPLQLEFPGGVRGACHYRPAFQVAGDMIQAIRLPGGRIAVWVLDVSGHGTQAALLSTTLHLTLEGICRQGVGEGEVSPEDPPELLRFLNRRFPSLERSGQYFTLLYGVIDPDQGLFRYARAGHPWPILLSPEGERVVQDDGGHALGLFPELQVPCLSLPLHRGEGVLLYSDGLLEARSRIDPAREFGMDGVLRVLSGVRGGGVGRSVRALAEALEVFTGALAPRDDVTLFGLERT